MSHSYSPSDVALTSLTLPDDLDPAVAASVNSPMQKLADGIKHITDLEATDYAHLLTGTCTPQIVEFTSTTNSWTFPPSAHLGAVLFACGGGGGGGDGALGTVGGTNQAAISGGGGGGSTFGVRTLSLTPGGLYDITLGAGGTAGAAGSPSTAAGDGGDGGDTTFKVHGGSTLATWTGGMGGKACDPSSTSVSTADDGIAPGGCTSRSDVSLRRAFTALAQITSTFAHAPGDGGDGCANSSLGGGGSAGTAGKRGGRANQEFSGGAAGSSGASVGSEPGGAPGGGRGAGPFGAGGAGGNGGAASSGSSPGNGTNGTGASANTGAGGGGGGSGGASASGTASNGGQGGAGGSGRLRILYWVHTT